MTWGGLEWLGSTDRTQKELRKNSEKTQKELRKNSERTRKELRKNSGRTGKAGMAGTAGMAGNRYSAWIVSAHTPRLGGLGKLRRAG